MTTPVAAQPDSTRSAAFPFFRFAGSRREIGQQFGEACRELIHRHLDLALERLQVRGSITEGTSYERALRFEAPVRRVAPFFAEEVDGLAEGAGLTKAQAYLLQLRAEIATPGPWTDELGETTDECTTFAVQPEATSNGIGIAGQNADLPAFYQQIGVVAEMRPDDGPATLMLHPAGQISYIGINDRGMSCFANFLTCDGWRIGFPRYFFSKYALMQSRVDDGIAAVQNLERASSRNMLMLDGAGNAADLETTPTRSARIDPVDGLLAHANHYVSPELLDEERSRGADLSNSRQRQQRMEELLREHRGQLNAQLMQTILRDRATAPDALCREPGDNDRHDTITFASVIAEPSEGVLWVAVGPPNQNDYVRHTLERQA